MKIDCGLNWEEKAKILKKWHPHFALWPTRVGHRDCRWLEWIERKGSYLGGPYGLWDWEYRARRGK